MSYPVYMVISNHVRPTVVTVVPIGNWARASRVITSVGFFGWAFVWVCSALGGCRFYRRWKVSSCNGVNLSSDSVSVTQSDGDASNTFPNTPNGLSPFRSPRSCGVLAYTSGSLRPSLLSLRPRSAPHVFCARLRPLSDVSGLTSA